MSWAISQPLIKSNLMDLLKCSWKLSYNCGWIMLRCCDKIRLNIRHKHAINTVAEPIKVLLAVLEDILCILELIQDRLQPLHWLSDTGLEFRCLSLAEDRYQKRKPTIRCPIKRNCMCHSIGMKSRWAAVGIRLLRKILGISSRG